ncbi:hypothetical protein L3Q82_013537 [Scortum barcoo]|uniref:Uncharacterized protein n=1 Tax=Scortum barcoo TaxID=214431 RepID=A0ACB8W0V1_9TELE|nr:hypothetical protein L3Q82_013537 [Scortum barcoo]
MIVLLVLLILKRGTVSASWSVTFDDPNPCAVKGSSVEFRCSYDYPDGEIVRKTFWSKGQSESGQWTRVKLEDLPSHQNRSKYLGDLQHNCSLAIHDLQVNDTGHYYFWFDTQKYGRHSRENVYLSVTEPSARVYPGTVRVGDTVTLECTTSCQFASTVWFKDRRLIANPKFQAQVEDSGNYACAVKGQESVLSDPVALEVQYPPLNVSVEASSLGRLSVNSSVTLTCNSAANPAADNYTWYSSAVSGVGSMLQVGSGQVLYIPSMEAQHAGLYICQARNRLGDKNSTEVLLTVDETNVKRLILLVGIGAKVTIVLLLTLVIIWAW